MIDLMLVLNGILVILAIIFIAKSLLVKYSLGKNILKNFILIFCSIVTVFISCNSLFSGFYLQDRKAYLELSLKQEHSNVLYNGVSEQTLLQEELTTIINHHIPNIKIATAAAYIFFGAAIVTSKSIKKELNKQIPAGKWDLRKYK